jgi:hypothetical protein
MVFRAKELFELAAVMLLTAVSELRTAAAWMLG